MADQTTHMNNPQRRRPQYEPMHRVPNSHAFWVNHAHGSPPRGTMAIYQGFGYRFALGRYSQHCDPRILSLFRMIRFAEGAQTSRALKALRRKIGEDFPKVAALQTYTSADKCGISYIADNWVFVLNRRGKKRWVRTL